MNNDAIYVKIQPPVQHYDSRPGHVEWQPGIKDALPN